MTQFILADRDDLLEMVNLQIKKTIRDEFEALEKARKEREKPIYVNRQEAADTLKISLSTLQRLVNQQYLTARKVGRKTLFLLSDVRNVVLTLNK